MVPYAVAYDVAYMVADEVVYDITYMVDHAVAYMSAHAVICHLLMQLFMRLPKYYTCANKGCGLYSKTIFSAVHNGTFYHLCPIFIIRYWVISWVLLIFKNLLYWCKYCMLSFI